jgi:hypothetical protein
MKYVFRAILALVLLAGLAYAVLPWKTWLEARLIATLEQQGVVPAQLKVSGLGLRGLTLRDIAVGDPAYRLSNLTVSYSPRLLLGASSDRPVTLRSEAVQFTAGTTPVRIGLIVVEAAPQGNWRHWRGTWQSSQVEASSDALTVPPLAGEGTLEITPQQFLLAGELANDTATHEADFSVQYGLEAGASSAAPSLLTITQARMPWGGGRVGVNNLTLPLREKATVDVVLKVERVGVQDLLQAMSSSGTTATGVVSGDVPLRLLPDGSVRIGKGALTAQEPGVITLAPDLIPGDNAQVALVREVMKNLQYSVLALSLEMGEDQTLAATLAVEGKNPTIEGGRPIKLNVHLSGDLLNLLLQNMKLMTDPHTFIEQRAHEPSS